MIAYLNGAYGSSDDLSIHPDDRGFLFADGIYEVVRYYHGRPLGLAAHRERLERGARSLRFARTEFPEFEVVLAQLMERNALAGEASAIVYFQATRGVAPRSHGFPAAGTPLTVYAFARPFQRHEEEIRAGAAAVTCEDDRWAHCDIKSIALLPNTLAHQAARDRGAVEALFLRGGEVQEGTHSNVMVVQDGRIRTAPLSAAILAGVTRGLVLDLARGLGIACDEAPVTRSDLFAAQEVFLTGTTVEITPITRLDGQAVGDGVPGPLTRRLQERFLPMVDAL